MTLEARVRQDYFLNSIQVLTGREYVKSEWRPVPAEKEKEARTHDLLEVREVGEKVALVEVIEETPFIPEEKPSRRRRKSTTEEAE